MPAPLSARVLADTIVPALAVIDAPVIAIDAAATSVPSEHVTGWPVRATVTSTPGAIDPN